MGNNGNLFGTANGGPNGTGSVFEVQTDSNTIITLATFDASTGDYPFGKLVEDSVGDLFGLTSYGGGAAEDGTVFELQAGSSTITTLASLNTSLGSDPGLAIDSSGDVFGTTTTGGASNFGTIFEVANAGGSSRTMTTLASFNGANGFGNQADLLADSSGNLFGCTQLGGLDNYGTVFEVAHGSGTITTLASFNGNDGQIPNGLVEDSRGNLFGTTEGCYAPLGRTGITVYAASQYGTVFEVAKGSGSTITTLAAFNDNDGAPFAGVVADSTGDLFGTTEAAAERDGTVFELAQDSSTIITLAPCDYPQTGLALDESGDLFGTTSNDGSAGPARCSRCPFLLPPSTPAMSACRPMLPA